MAAQLLDSDLLRNAEEALDFIGTLLESSTEYSIIGKDLDGTIVLWNEGARRIYGYLPEEVIGKANAAVLHTPEDVAAGKPREILEAARRDGKWQGTLARVRKNGERLTARAVVTPRRDAAWEVAGYLLISNDITEETCLADAMRHSQERLARLVESAMDAIIRARRHRSSACWPRERALT